MPSWGAATSTCRNPGSSSSPWRTPSARCTPPRAGCRRSPTRCPRRSPSFSRMAGRMLGPEHPFAWEGFEDNDDIICGHIASVVDGFEDFNVHKGCNVIFLNPEDLAALQLAAGGYVDVHSEAPDGVQRCSAGCGSFPIPGPAAALRPISPRRTCSFPCPRGPWSPAPRCPRPPSSALNRCRHPTLGSDGTRPRNPPGRRGLAAARRVPGPGGTADRRRSAVRCRPRFVGSSGSARSIRQRAHGGSCR